MPIKHQERTSFQGIELTNHDRVYYPKEGITKADLCVYYEKIADRMLPLVGEKSYMSDKQEKYLGE